MRIKKFSKFYFEFWENYFLGISISLVFDDVFTSLFEVFSLPFSHSLLCLIFLCLHWIQCSVFWIPVLGIQMHRCKQLLFQFPVPTRLSFILQIIPYIHVLVLWYLKRHSTETLISSIRTTSRVTSWAAVCHFNYHMLPAQASSGKRKRDVQMINSPLTALRNLHRAIGE